MTSTLDQVEFLLAAGRAADSIAILESETRLRPDSFEIWHCLGRAYGLAGRPVEAERAFRVAVRLRPDSHEANYNLALALAHQNKLRDSIGYFVNARKINPRNPEFHDTLLPVLIALLQQSAESESARTGAFPSLGEQPLVSVVMPTQNRLLMLRDALNSVCRQRYQNWEVIVVNDGDSDVSPILNGLPSEIGARIFRIDLRGGSGPAAARNAAIKIAQGRVLAFLDDDDLYSPVHLERLIGGLRASDAGIAYTSAELVRETVRDGTRMEISREPFLTGLRYSRSLLLLRNFIPINTWGVRRECFDAVGVFDEDLHYLEDWDFLVRLSSSVNFHQISEVTAEYRMTELTDDSITKRQSHAQAVKSFYRRHDTHGLEWRELARELYLETLA